MTAHELAHKLLEGPDVPVASYEADTDEYLEIIEATLENRTSPWENAEQVEVIPPFIYLRSKGPGWAQRAAKARG